MYTLSAVSDTIDRGNLPYLISLNDFDKPYPSDWYFIVSWVLAATKNTQAEFEVYFHNYYSRWIPYNYHKDILDYQLSYLG